MGKGLPYALGSRAWMARLNKLYLLYTLAFVSLVAVLGVLEQMGMPRSWIGFVFLIATIGVYAAIGLVCRTTDATEYYVAGRSVPAVYNGMATGADWMSAASFIGMAGTLYISGYTGLAFVLGWTGGYVLVALLLAPYLRKFGQFTIPDFLGERYGGHIPRLIGVVAVILVSFTYVVAQIYGVGLITSRLTGVAFELGVFLGLGGILVCSFLGGMRAVTWTQVAQYIVLIVAFLIPVMWLSIKQTSSPVPQLSYGYQLAQVGQLEQTLISDPKELEVQAIFAQRAKDLEAKLLNPASALRADRKAAQTLVASLKAAQAPLNERAAAERVLATMPRTLDGATNQWRAQLEVANTKMKPLNGMTPHAQPFAGDPDGSEQERDSFETSRRNFIALVFCLVFGTAALPHVLVRYYTTPSVRAARQSVTWSLFFILLLL